MASYEKTKNDLMEIYPTVYFDELTVLNYLFFYSTDYEWKNGSLQESHYKSKSKKIKSMRNEYRNTLINLIKIFKEIIKKADSKPNHADLIKKILTKQIKNTRRELRNLETEGNNYPEKERGRQKINILKTLRKGLSSRINPDAYVWFLCEDGTIGLKSYLCEDSNIMKIPKDVKPDWLKAARKVLSFVSEGKIKIREDYIEWVEKAKAQVNSK